MLSCVFIHRADVTMTPSQQRDAGLTTHGLWSATHAAPSNGPNQKSFKDQDRTYRKTLEGFRKCRDYVNINVLFVFVRLNCWIAKIISKSAHKPSIPAVEQLGLGLYNDPLPDSYLLHAFVIENAYQAAASREPKSGSLYKWVSTQSTG